MPQPEPSRLCEYRVHQEPADAAATQRLVYDHVVNMPDRAETDGGHNGQRRRPNQDAPALCHDEDKPVVAQPLHEHVV